ncbi:Arylsulfatase [Thalassoglobus neptunius]|uniref:Arylsulfatase n=1 Tax=Thalassoglobus neptunius TaxID=1938619 RepID=A0A5C5X9A5_9PLAN|nr:sulfatase-like hydrolase/transferase [Thalassoglobus neptunius]TWT58452.1 Arylsulfatase [Thalassoglobus neptunius]
MNRPHVLLITTDHWPATLLGAAGHQLIQTPTLDELARQGTRFTNAYSECPICIPARRTLLTGMKPRSHGDRTFQTTLEMPSAPTLAQSFRDAGYQAYAVGKLHVYPQRNRIGFDDVLLAEEGRPHDGVIDDYDLYLGDEGFVGQQFEHGMSNNQYFTRTWHLPERCHVTNWTARSMSRMIRRRDPTRPGFWYLSFTHPHPPLVPLQHYWDIYQQVNPAMPECGEWAPPDWSLPGSECHPGKSHSDSRVPWLLNMVHNKWTIRTQTEYFAALRAVFALCTHIDHQIRFVLGTLREEGLLDETMILFTSDHGDMFGQHGLWGKRLFYEGAANVPMILVPPAGQSDDACGHVDSRLVGLQDVMPTLLEMCAIDVPDSCDGRSMTSSQERNVLYGECNEGATATRMIRRDQFKLIYYAAGNVFQLFDLDADPNETVDLSRSASHAEVLDDLKTHLREHLHGSDAEWLDDNDEWVGLSNDQPPLPTERGLFLQRGTHWPPPYYG